MDSENKDLEIVMGDDSELDISSVGDIMNNLKPNTSEKKKNIIIPLAKKKTEENEDEETSEDNEENENEEE